MVKTFRDMWQLFTFLILIVKKFRLSYFFTVCVNLTPTFVPRQDRVLKVVTRASYLPSAKLPKPGGRRFSPLAFRNGTSNYKAGTSLYFGRDWPEYWGTTSAAVSYTHLDVYKRQGW